MSSIDPPTPDGFAATQPPDEAAQLLAPSDRVRAPTAFNPPFAGELPAQGEAAEPSAATADVAAISVAESAVAARMAGGNATPDTLRGVAPAATPGSRDRVVCVVLHDVADPTLAACERLVAAIAEVAAVPLTLLAVPRYHHTRATPALEQWLGHHHAAGDEIALHGYTHLDDGVPRNALDRLRRQHYTRGEGEFWALPAADAAARLDAGMDWFRRNGWPLHGFVAPAWLLGDGAWEALRATPIRYTATLRHIHLLSRPGRISSQSIVYSTSSEWRRQTSRAWARVVAAMVRTNPVMRFELHPRDADHPKVRLSWQRLLEQALRQRQPHTVAQLAAGWRTAERHATLAPSGHPGEGLKAD